MVDIVVQRQGGANQGSDIVNPMISTTTVAIKRGQAEIDREGTKYEVQTSTLYQTGFRKGQTVKVLDDLTGQELFGVVKGITHAFDGNTSKTILEMERDA